MYNHPNDQTVLGLSSGLCIVLIIHFQTAKLETMLLGNVVTIFPVWRKKWENWTYE